MSDFYKIKQELLQACFEFVNNRAKTIVQNLESHKKALFSETKSSAGDKHETGRAMIQLEMEKASQQMESMLQMKKTLDKITLSVGAEVISLGNAVITDKGNYYLSISVGKVEVEGNQYFCVSTNSPVGAQLLGKRINDIIPFNKAQIARVF
jgi:transcription elongation GreA/GreB family factor